MLDDRDESPERIALQAEIVRQAMELVLSLPPDGMAMFAAVLMDNPNMTDVDFSLFYQNCGDNLTKWIYDLY